MELKPCDIVMQGGITSGVVYPAAVLALKDSHRFVSIGGASAGAIAAAVTAAAELGRARDGGGFDRLKVVSDQLSQPGFLLRLFQPSPRTRPLLEMFLAVLRGAHQGQGQPRGVSIALQTLVAACRFLTGALIAGALGGLVLFGVTVWLTQGSAEGRSLVLAALLVLAGMLAGAVACLLKVLLRDVPANGYGIARGLRTSDEPALTEWLTSALDRLAGPSTGQGPLTFGMLEQEGITLRAITTNLSEQRPYRLPFENHRFIFAEAELRDYFPAAVVDHLIRHAEPNARVSLPAGFHFLPCPQDLPVVLATRLSLSFPVLVSAVPLYNIRLGPAPTGTPGDPRVISPGELRRCWFSDGGICSNFPIHFFDAWVPSRPTFGISLITGEVETVHNLHDGEPAAIETPPDRNVHLPAANRPEPAHWRAIAGLDDFLGRVVGTALDYRDTLQKELPSYRERVVQIHLSSAEGGLNLDMSPERVKVLMARGQTAGERLAGFDFPRHLWVRLRVLVPRLVEQLHKLGERREDGLLDLERLVRGLSAEAMPYPVDPEWYHRAQDLLMDLAEARRHLTDAAASHGEPKPPSVMRVTPPV